LTSYGSFCGIPQPINDQVQESVGLLRREDAEALGRTDYLLPSWRFAVGPVPTLDSLIDGSDKVGRRPKDQPSKR